MWNTRRGHTHPPQLNTNQDSTGNKLLKERESEKESGRASERERERETRVFRSPEIIS